MRNYTRTFNCITCIIFSLFFGISVNALAQDYTCPSNVVAYDNNISAAEDALENEINIIKSLTGYTSVDEANLYCDQKIKEKTARVNEFHIDDYEGAIVQIKREKDETKTLLEQQTSACKSCLASKLDAYEKKFIKKHGDHRYDTKGYRTKVVVIWGEAERIPTDAQAKYNLIYDEYMSNYDPSNDKQECFENTPACKSVVEAKSKISSLELRMSAFQERRSNEISAKHDLEQTAEICDRVAKSTEKYSTLQKRIAFLKECKYPEKSETNSTNTENHHNVNMNNLQQANKAVNNAHSVGRIFGL